MKRFLLLALLACGFASWASPSGDKPARGYHLEFIVQGGRDTIMLLGDHYRGDQYVFDTAFRDKHGRFVFDNKDRVLLPGLYFFCTPEGKNVEFVIHNEQPNFVFTTQEGYWAEHIKVKGSKENALYFDYYQRVRIPHFAALYSAKNSMSPEDFKQHARKMQGQLDSIDFAFADAHPGTMLALLINAERPVQVPSQDQDGNPIDRQSQFEYFVAHYFDHVDLSDNALVRTPKHIFYQRVRDFIDKGLNGATPQVIINLIDPLIDRAKPAPEVFRYLVCEFAEYYLTSNVMSYDAVYVHLIQRYYATGQAFWASPSNVDENVKRANTWENLLVGKVAPELIMRDRSGKLHSLLHGGHKYTLLVFWSPTCGHCQLMIPSLYQKFVQYADLYDVGAYAVLSEPDDATRPKWNDFIRNNHMDNPRWLHVDGGEANIDWHEVYDVETTPQIYLLDRDGRIIGKRLNAENFEFILKTYEGMK